MKENHELSAMITVVIDGEIGVDEEMLKLFNSRQKETFKDVKVNPGLSVNRRNK